jgi:hypothetical protein
MKPGRGWGIETRDVETPGLLGPFWFVASAVKPVWVPCSTGHKAIFRTRNAAKTAMGDVGVRRSFRHARVVRVEVVINVIRKEAKRAGADAQGRTTHLDR